MTDLAKDDALITDTIAYVIELYQEISGENGAPSLGTQNQTADFILADPELRRAVKNWSEVAQPDEATLAPPRRLPNDPAYRRIAEFMRAVMEVPVFQRRASAP